MDVAVLSRAKNVLHPTPFRLDQLFTQLGSNLSRVPTHGIPSQYHLPVFSMIPPSCADKCILDGLGTVLVWERSSVTS